MLRAICVAWASELGSLHKDLNKLCCTFSVADDLLGQALANLCQSVHECVVVFVLLVD